VSYIRLIDTDRGDEMTPWTTLRDYAREMIRAVGIEVPYVPVEVKDEGTPEARLEIDGVTVCQAHARDLALAQRQMLGAADGSHARWTGESDETYVARVEATPVAIVDVPVYYSGDCHTPPDMDTKTVAVRLSAFRAVDDAIRAVVDDRLANAAEAFEMAQACGPEE
jgi:hypothetical protein